MRHRNTERIWIKMAAVSVAALSLGLGACSPGEKTGMETMGMETAGMEAAGMETTDIGTAGMETTGIGTAGIETTGMETTGIEPADLAAEAQAVNGTDEEDENVAEPKLRLELPEDDSMYSQASTIQQDNRVIQIQFHHENTGSDAIIWASIEAEGGPSEYYMFDEDGIRSEMADIGAGGPLEMTIRKTVENSDIHGILISWEYDGVYYELWEDDAREQADRVLQMAAAIASQSIVKPETGNR